ncbi:outer-membrane lipoprotein carrier protein LolA [Congregibacter variabilis]|uniref:Outer-membrane lipoprotein carrier protein LolA n=1 Tax=Congregibacter variabilis TaxID=3081200 RepID=A0ABZ0I6G0_9GAMM|nr:outer-membrane lipoprotein carrier protein LolA [Congregibacter sp. IMCC43200]
MLKTGFTAAWVMVLLWGTAALAQNETEEVWILLAAQSQASGGFVQELFDESEELLERSSGRYAVLRPGFFRWEIEDPDQQMIVVSGTQLWHYDIDLAAATRRDTSQSNEFTPLELLAGDSDELRGRFEAQRLGPARVRLIPTFPQAGFASVDIAWEGDAVIAMDVQDRSGQMIKLDLSPDPNPAQLTAKDFEFVAPAGVDVYEPSDY